MGDVLNKAAIAAVLIPLLDPAAEFFAVSDKMSELGIWLPLDYAALNALTEKVEKVLAEQETFRDHPKRQMLSPAHSILVTPNLFSGLLLRESVRRGPTASVEWLERVMSTKTATGRFVAHISGVTVPDELVLSDELTLLPFQQLQDTDAKQTFVRSNETVPGRVRLGQQPHLETAAYFRVPEAPFFVESIEDVPDPFALLAADEFECQITALTAIDGCCPTIEGRWFEFDDPDLNAAANGTAFSWRAREGWSAFQETLIGSDAAVLLAKRRALDQRSLAVVDLALARLNLAMRRLTPGDKAIDASICLEALLCSAKEESSLTSILKSRAANLTGGSAEEQKAAQKAVAALYTLRGKTVHGRISRSARKPTPEDIVAAGLPLCTKLIRTLIYAGGVPEWSAP